MGKITILPETTKDPISLIGRRAGVCWGADITSEEKNYKRGISCIKANHGRVLEFVNVEAIIDGYSARVIREWYTHIGGSPTRLQASTRYIDYKDFKNIIPPKIASDVHAANIYKECMQNIQNVTAILETMGMPREDIGMLLPLGMATKIVDKRNVRNIMDMSRQRMCSRAYWEYRQMFVDYIAALSDYSEEWETLIPMIMKPKCDALGYCPESNSCGRKPKSKE